MFRKNKTKEGRIYRNDDLPLWEMGILGAVVGVIVGLVTIVFGYMIAFVHNLAFLGKFSFSYDANTHTQASPWGIFFILIPVVGAFLVIWIVKTFAPDAKGHGVPEVIDAVYFKEGKIRYMVGVVKAIASSITIGTGGSVGNEGPFVQVGAAFASAVGQIGRISKKQRNILIAAGASAGLAACFNTPLTGLAFGIELVLVSINAATVFPVIIATVVTIYICRQVIGVAPIFNIPSLINLDFSILPFQELLFFVPFGVAVGICSVVFIKVLYYMEDICARFSKNAYIRHMAGMLVLGIFFYLMFRVTGKYYICGLGTATIFDVLNGTLLNPWFLFLLVVLKIFATSLTLGSGGAGGIFTPCMFMGAAFGYASAALFNMFFPELKLDPVVFAVAGMGGMVSATVGAFLTGTLLVFELFRNTHYCLPIMLTVAIAYIVRKSISAESIYTKALFKKGLIVHDGLQANVVESVNARYQMSKAFKLVDVSDIIIKGSEIIFKKGNDIEYIVIKNGEMILGFLKDDLYDIPDDMASQMNKYIDKRFLLFAADVKVSEVAGEFKRKMLKYALIMNKQNSHKAKSIVGVISEKELANFSEFESSLLS